MVKKILKHKYNTKAVIKLLCLEQKIEYTEAKVTPSNRKKFKQETDSSVKKKNQTVTDDQSDVNGSGKWYHLLLLFN